ncbi:MAG TPA: ABC transporter ATP-binding protein, partial [Actinomycetota bacterium]|nr:ABC transporter ATP-binding protein [Actinomycetota bacterium]
MSAGWRSGAEVLHGVSVAVAEHEIVSILGSNGAGKSTLLSVIAGLLSPWAGSVHFEGELISGLPAHTLVGRGLVMVPSGRKVFARQTVTDNLLMGATPYRGDRVRVRRNLESTLVRFPSLMAKRREKAAQLSGGEQQLLCLARGLMARPRLLMLDEPTMGLQPSALSGIFELIRELRDEGTTVLMVEKHASAAAEISDRLLVMELGSVVLSGPSSEVISDERVVGAYLGSSAP